MRERLPTFRAQRQRLPGPRATRPNPTETIPTIPVRDNCPPYKTTEHASRSPASVSAKRPFQQPSTDWTLRPSRTPPRRQTPADEPPAHLPSREPETASHDTPLRSRAVPQSRQGPNKRKPLLDQLIGQLTQHLAGPRQHGTRQTTGKIRPSVPWRRAAARPDDRKNQHPLAQSHPALDFLFQHFAHQHHLREPQWQSRKPANHYIHSR